MSQESRRRLLVGTGSLLPFVGRPWGMNNWALQVSSATYPVCFAGVDWLLYCIPLPFTASHCSSLPFTAFHCLSPPLTAFHCRPLPSTAVRSLQTNNYDGAVASPLKSWWYLTTPYIGLSLAMNAAFP